MVARELNGLRKYLIGVGITVTGAAVIQIGLLLVWIGEARVRIQNNADNIGRLEATVLRHERMLGGHGRSDANSEGG